MLTGTYETDENLNFVIVLKHGDKKIKVSLESAQDFEAEFGVDLLPIVANAVSRQFEEAGIEVAPGEIEYVIRSLKRQ